MNRLSWLCRIGLHAYPRYVTAHTQAPAPVRCERCRKTYGSRLDLEVSQCPGEVTGFTLSLDEAELIERLRTLGTGPDLYPVLPLLAASGVTTTGVQVLCNIYARGRIYAEDFNRLQADGLLLEMRGGEH